MISASLRTFAFQCQLHSCRPMRHFSTCFRIFKETTHSAGAHVGIYFTAARRKLQGQVGFADFIAIHDGIEIKMIYQFAQELMAHFRGGAKAQSNIFQRGCIANIPRLAEFRRIHVADVINATSYFSVSPALL